MGTSLPFMHPKIYLAGFPQPKSNTDMELCCGVVVLSCGVVALCHLCYVAPYGVAFDVDCCSMWRCGGVVLSCGVMLRQCSVVLGCNTLLCRGRIVSCHVMLGWYYLVSCWVVSSHVVGTVLCHVEWCHLMWCWVGMLLCHVGQCHLMWLVLCHVR